MCRNRYVLEEAFINLFIMSWNEIAGNYNDYLDFWNMNLEEGNELLCHKTKQVRAAAKKGMIKNFDGELMIWLWIILKCLNLASLQSGFMMEQNLNVKQNK